jgi:tetratricopeptide (TPR) repeat protein
VILSLFSISAYSQSNYQINSFAKSIKLEREREYIQAINVLKESYDPKSYETNLRLGWLYYMAGQYADSKSYYLLAMGSMPNSLEAKVGYLYPVAATSTSDLTSLLNQYNKILEINPKDVNSNYQLGFYNYNKGNLEIAKNYFSKILDLYPSAYEYDLRIAWAKVNKLPINDKLNDVFAKSYEFETKRNFSSAIAVLKDIYDPTYYDVNLRLGWLYYKNAQYAESEKYYKTAIDLKPNATEPRLGYTYPLHQLGNRNELITQYKKIIELDPFNTDAHYQLGMLYYDKKEYAAADESFQKIVDLYPFTYYGVLMSGWTNYQLNKKDEAKKLFHKVLMIVPSDKSALEGLALIK